MARDQHVRNDTVRLDILVTPASKVAKPLEGINLGAGVDRLERTFLQGSFCEESCSVTIFVVLLASDLGKAAANGPIALPGRQNRGYVKT